MRNKKLLELWSSIFILLFLFTFLGSFFFIFPHDSDYLAVIEPFFSFCPPVFMIVYLIIFGPLGLSGFDERLSKYLVFTSGSLLSILLFYSLLNSLETLFDKNSIIIAALFLSILVVFLQLKIVDILYKIDSNKIDNFICFIKKTNFELFEKRHLKELNRLLIILKITCLCLVGMNNKMMLIMFLLIQLLIRYSLHKKFTETITYNQKLIKKFNHYGKIEVVIFILILIALFFNLKPITFILILCMDFKFPFIKEKIINLKYLKYLKDTGI